MDSQTKAALRNYLDALATMTDSVHAVKVAQARFTEAGRTLFAQLTGRVRERDRAAFGETIHRPAALCDIDVNPTILAEWPNKATRLVADVTYEE